MIEKYLSVAFSGMLYLASTVFSEETVPQSSEKIPLKKETSTEVVTEVFDKGKVEKKDIFNFISRIDEEKIADRKKYSRGSYLEGFCEALQDRIEEDPFFYIGEEYDENEIIVKNQMLNAVWDVGVANFPKLLGRVEKTGVYIKEKTTFRARVGAYKLKISPELDNEDFLKIKTKIKAMGGDYTNSILNDLAFKVGRDDIQLEKNWYIPQIAQKAEFCFDMSYDWKREEYCAKIMFKLPIWPEKPEEK